ncbi:MAG: cephalosporin hydroxylase [Acidobacteria bacterium RIFCSPLOWO2_02_FULL_67_36]|nr:MAG: cephalosporin hydroxylase [Acidobacteria bacterium RIFCSPLOWO2_02_FULL_67_36]OFW23109.1 MAG: cephalosporin hydroxylase [Acidobacteria bacterium RIFCSPLOWO2_12_FULL_66_21]
MSDFEERNRTTIAQMHGDVALESLTRDWFVASVKHGYAHHFTWLGRPIIQYPQDIIAMQEIIWRTRPDLIVETGVAHGGSLVFYASMLELLGGDGLVVGVDVEIRSHNRAAIETHPMSKRIGLIEGSSTDEAVLRQVRERARGRQRVLVTLDSSHTHEHVRQELQVYSPLIKKDGYLVVFDTVIEEMPDGSIQDRPWGRGNSPGTAVQAFLSSNDRFVVDREIDGKLLITAAPGGYLKCVAD